MPSVYWLKADIHSLGNCLIHHNVEAFLSEQGYPNKGSVGYQLSKQANKEFYYSMEYQNKKSGNSSHKFLQKVFEKRDPEGKWAMAEKQDSDQNNVRRYRIP